MSSELTAFFTRLLQPTSDLGIKNHPVAVDDVETFERAWVIVQATLMEPDERMLLRGIAITDVPEQLEWMVNAMIHENDHFKGTTGSCTEFFLNNDILHHLVQLSATDRPFGALSEAIRSITTLLISLPPDFLLHSPVHRSIAMLLRSTISGILNSEISLGDISDGQRILGAAATARETAEDEGQAERIEEDLVDLICVVVTSVRDFRPLLLIFFATISPTVPESAPLESLLFTFLLRHIHREGRTGSFARSSILAVLDTCLMPPSLPSTLESQAMDRTRLQMTRSVLGEIQGQRFADLIAAGLGAIYSVLPFKLRLPTAAEQNGIPDSGGSLRVSSGPKGGEMYLGLHNYADDDYVRVEAAKEDEGLDCIYDERVNRQLDAMGELMGFAEDVLDRCRKVRPGSEGSSEIENHMALLAEEVRATIRVSFFQGIIYPAVLECSSSDGSAVAVLSYLAQFLSDLRLRSLGRDLAVFLMGLEIDSNSDQTSYVLPVAKFTIKDLILDTISATNSQSAGIAGLSVMALFFRKFCPESSIALVGGISEINATAFVKDLKGGEMPDEECSSDSDDNIETQNKPLQYPALGIQESLLADQVERPDPDAELYSSLLPALDPSLSLADCNSYLTDGYSVLCSDDCFQAGLARVKQLNVSATKSITAPHRLDSSDSILRALLLNLQRFFEHTAEYNVALTGAIGVISVCPCRNLNTWMTGCKREPQSDLFFPSNSGDEKDEPMESQESLPALYQILQDLVEQVGKYRSQVNDFDWYLAERRKGLFFSERMEDAMNIMLDTEQHRSSWTPQRNLPSATPSPRRATPVKLASSLVSFLTPRKRSAGPEESPSPFSFRAAFSQEPPASPYEIHYRKTTAIQVVPFAVDEVQSGPWSPAKRPSSLRDIHHSISTSSAAESSPIEDLRMAEKQEQKPEAPPKQVTLSMLLDNCVVLEEFIKECVGKILVRRTLGVDGLDATLETEE